MKIPTRPISGALALVACVLAIAAGPAARQDPTVDPWARVRVLVGEWEGAAEGRAGSGVSRRTYAFVLGGRYLHEKNVSTYPAQEKNKTGEVHEHWSLISHDRERRVLVLRQFHQEGFVTSMCSTPPRAPLKTRVRQRAVRESRRQLARL
jgi:hypothetical protein